MITGTPKKLIWDNHNCCHISNCVWIKIEDNSNQVYSPEAVYKAIEYNEMIGFKRFPKFSEENNFRTIEEAKAFVQSFFDECWMELTEIKVNR